MAVQFFSRTLLNPVHFYGIGIHSGKKVSLSLLPSKIPGIVFRRTDQNGASLIASPQSVQPSSRFTLLSNEATIIQTPEHLLSACAGLGITHLCVDIDQDELPILDGSALFYVDMLQKAEIVPLSDPVSPVIIKTPLFVSHEGAKLFILPSDQPLFSYYLSYPNTFIKDQVSHFNPQHDSYITDIAPARTYGFLNEVQALLDQGLAKGGGLDNAVIIDKDRHQYLAPLRFPDELSRHKLLDLMGDMWLLGRPVLGHIIGIQSGHFLNAQLLNRLTQ